MYRKTPPLMTRSQMTVAKTQIMIHGPENPLFLQIQEGTHISLSNSGSNSECSSTATAESWSTRSLEDQEGSRFGVFQGLKHGKYKWIMMATAKGRRMWSWGQRCTRVFQPNIFPHQIVKQPLPLFSEMSGLFAPQKRKEKKPGEDTCYF